MRRTGALYEPGSSALHHLDPRAKLLAVLAVLAIAITTTRMDLLIPLLLVVVLVLEFVGRISITSYWKVVAAILPLILILVLIQGLVHEGPTLVEVGPLTLTSPGVLVGLGLGLRLATMGLCFYGFARTTSPTDISLALHRSGMPYKYAFLATFAFRFLPLVQDETRTLLMAMASRGSAQTASKNPFARGAAVVRMIFPLLVGSLRRSGEIALCMELRGYGLPVKRTFMRVLKFRPADAVLMTCALVLLVGYVTVRLSGTVLFTVGAAS